MRVGRRYPDIRMQRLERGKMRATYREGLGGCGNNSIFLSGGGDGRQVTGAIDRSRKRWGLEYCFHEGRGIEREDDREPCT